MKIRNASIASPHLCEEGKETSEESTHGDESGGGTAVAGARGGLRRASRGGLASAGGLGGGRTTSSGGSAVGVGTRADGVRGRGSSSTNGCDGSVGSRR